MLYTHLIVISVSILPRVVMVRQSLHYVICMGDYITVHCTIAKVAAKKGVIKMINKGKKRVYIDITPILHKELKVSALEADKTLIEYISDILVAFKGDKHGRKKSSIKKSRKR